MLWKCANKRWLLHKGNQDENCHCQRSILQENVILTSNLNIKLKKKLVMCYDWSIALYGSETWTLSKLERKYLESFEMWCWRRMGNIEWSDKVMNKVLNV
jgi:hypothetical protein